MPLYGFECVACGHGFEHFLKIAQRNDPVEAPCPKCGEFSVHQQLGANPVLDPYRMGIHKPPEGFRDLLRHIKHRNYGNKLNID